MACIISKQKPPSCTRSRQQAVGGQRAGPTGCTLSAAGRAASPVGSQPGCACSLPDQQCLPLKPLACLGHCSNMVPALEQVGCDAATEPVAGGGIDRVQGAEQQNPGAEQPHLQARRAVFLAEASTLCLPGQMHSVMPCAAQHGASWSMHYHTPQDRRPRAGCWARLRAGQLARQCPPAAGGARPARPQSEHVSRKLPTQCCCSS